GTAHYQQIVQALQADYGTALSDPIAAHLSDAATSILDW
ncbi:hypothetical protein C8N38_1191, partial [Rhodovulum kholense]